MKITRLGHACVLLEGSKTVIIDPFITDNPAASVALDGIPKLDLILVTHDHYDHIGDAKVLASRDEAEVIAIHEIATSEDFKKLTATAMNIGGTYSSKGVQISMTPAVHSANSVGFVVYMDGIRVYHSGDTALFSDMKLIPELFGDLDLAMLPIGGHFTMDSFAAEKAVELLKTQRVIPIHYNTWPPIQADPQEFADSVETANVEVLEPGESLEL